MPKPRGANNCRAAKSRNRGEQPFADLRKTAPLGSSILQTCETQLPKGATFYKAAKARSSGEQRFADLQKAETKWGGIMQSQDKVKS